MAPPYGWEVRQTMLGVRARPAAWLACGLWLVSVGLAVASALLPGRGGGGLGTMLALWAVTNATVGAIVAIRRPAHRIGWLLVAIGLLLAVDSFAEQYARYGLLAGLDAIRAVPTMAWVSFWLDAPALFLLVFVIVLFPNGQLPSRRWRPVAWLLALAAAAGAGVAFRPGELPELAPIRNPFGVQGATMALELLETGSLVVFAGVVVALAVSLLRRLQRAQGRERSQLQWFTYAVGLVGVSLAVHLAAVVVGLPLVESATLVALLVAILGIPVAIGIAVLRYRLYDIDRLINRTLVYGLLTALLGLVYATAVLVLGQVFGGIGTKPPSWAVAGATLTVAALFQPARRRIQAVVDRRFNRRRYNAAKTIEAFSARLREQLDLDTLSGELLAVVDQTMQPNTASLWLRLPTSASQDLGAPLAQRPEPRPTGPSQSGRRGL
jgi:hypothetical protein